MSVVSRSMKWGAVLAVGLMGQALHAEDARYPQPAIEDLGDGQFRIGAIEIDKNAGRFQVPGQVIQLDNPATPIEFLVVTKGGMKSYEALFELNTSAIEFNLACIVIGLDAARATAPQVHFDPAKLEGDAVAVSFGWQQDGKPQRVTGGELLGAGQSAAGLDDWVYTGSHFSPDGYYMAEESGTLVGFVHDADSIIQHRTGLGIGDYGAFTASSVNVPAPGTPITFYLEKSDRP